MYYYFYCIDCDKWTLVQRIGAVTRCYYCGKELKESN